MNPSIIEEITKSADNFIKLLNVLKVEIETFSEIVRQHEANQIAFAEKEKSLRDRENKLEQTKQSNQQEREYVNKAFQDLSLKENQIIKIDINLQNRKKEIEEKERILQESETKLNEDKQKMGELQEKEQELADREKMLQKEIVIDRERKELLAAKDKAMQAREARLQRISSV